MSTMTLGPTVGLETHAPSPPRYRLLDVATVIDVADEHIFAGIEVWPWIDARSGGAHNPCATGTNREKNGMQERPDELPEFASFTIYETLECTARSIGVEFDYWASLTVQALRAVESKLIEEEFAKGTRVPTNPHLALVPTTSDVAIQVLNGGAAMGVVPALALLEQSAAVTGAAHLVHIDPATSVKAASQQLVYDQNGNCYLYGTGSRVVVGTGYVGAEPDGEALADATHSWVWATGPVEIRRGPIRVNPPTVGEAMNTVDNNNDITLRAERDVVVSWDTGLQLAVLVDRAA